MEIKYIDIHAHINMNKFDTDRSDVVLRAKESGILIIDSGADFNSSTKAVKFANENENIWATIGMHPEYSFGSDKREFDYNSFKDLGLKEKVVGIGECGLDYFNCDKERLDEISLAQKDIFRKHIELSLELNKPLMLHLRSGNSRNAYKEAYEILKEYYDKSNGKLRGNLHFFAGTFADAQLFLSMNFFFSFTGVITFAKEYGELIKKLPIENIMTETDCPFVAPIPFRGKRCEPAYIIEIVREIASIKGLSVDEASNILFNNALKFFGIAPKP